MRMHILGICGTFMGSLAVLARESGLDVAGSDANVYPPMSTQLENQGIRLTEGYSAANLQPHPDLIVVGNAMSRGNDAVEYTLSEGLNYTSGPQWLAEHVLAKRWVIAVAGTHGKTTTTTLVAWILEWAKKSPGFLIGGVPANFSVSARLGTGPNFVVEADEYDSAFFDKRSKFIHYRPRTAILNNLEFDHGDIFENLDAIKKQFHHLVRTIPANGQIICPEFDENIADVLQKGCWTPVVTFSLRQADAKSAWQAEMIALDGSHFRVYFNDNVVGDVQWPMSGKHSVLNGLAAIIAACHAGVEPKHAVAALNEFKGVKRRMELVGEVNGVKVFDDFAHHPTAIETTLQGARAALMSQGKGRLVAVIEPRSNTMRMGLHRNSLAASTDNADEVIWYQPPGLNWNLDDVVAQSKIPAQVISNIDEIISYLVKSSQSGDQIVLMSNGGFGGIHLKLVEALNTAV